MLVCASSLYARFFLIHFTDYDPEIGFKGLPSQWQELLTDSGLTEGDAAAAPQTFVATLKFHSNYVQGVQPPSPAIAARVPGAQVPLGEEVPVSLEQLVSKDDPRSRFISAAQDLIGAGGAAEVFLATVSFFFFFVGTWVIEV